MANSEFDICSQALIKLGAQPIQSFDASEGDKGRICANLYPNFRQNALSIHRWRFAISKAALSKEVVTIVSEWQEQFTLPPDRLGPPNAVFNTASVGASPITTGWEIFGGKLLTNENEIIVDYSVLVPEIQWPAYFEAFAVDFLSIRLAVPITDQVTARAAMAEDTFGPPRNPELGSFYQGKRIDGQHNAPGRIQTFGPLVQARLGSRSNRAGRGLVSG